MRRIYDETYHALIDIHTIQDGWELPNGGIEKNKSVGGKVWTHKNSEGHKVFNIWVQDANDINAFTHEMGHLALAIMGDRGALAEAHNSEPFCYYLGNLAGKILPIYTGQQYVPYKEPKPKLYFSSLKHWTGWIVPLIGGLTTYWFIYWLITR